MSREVTGSKGNKTVSRTDRQGNLKSEKTVYKGIDGYKEKTKLKVSPKKYATSKPQATLTTTIKDKGGSKKVIERKGDYDSDYEYIRGNDKTILDRSSRKERRDLKRSSIMMKKIKNPFINESKQNTNKRDRLVNKTFEKGEQTSSGMSASKGNLRVDMSQKLDPDSPGANIYFSKLDRKGRVKKEITFSNSELDDDWNMSVSKKTNKIKKKNREKYTSIDDK